MSVQQAQSELKHISDDIARHEKKKSESERKSAEYQEKIISKQQEIARTASESSRKSKQTQLQGYQRDLVRAQKDVASEGKLLLGLYDRKMRAEKKLQSEMTKEQQQAQQEMQRTLDEMQQTLSVRQPAREPNQIVSCILPLLVGLPEVAAQVERANDHYIQGNSDRNALDDMRLAFEMLLQQFFGNEKSIENQKDIAGRILKGAGNTPEFRNMINTLIDYYTKYQNNHVKHADSINAHEVDFIIELTAILMKQLITQFDDSEAE